MIRDMTRVAISYNLFVCSILSLFLGTGGWVVWDYSVDDYYDGLRNVGVVVGEAN